MKEGRRNEKIVNKKRKRKRKRQTRKEK